MVGSSQTDLPSVTDPRTWESTHRILSPIRPHGLAGRQSGECRLSMTNALMQRRPKKSIREETLKSNRIVHVCAVAIAGLFSGTALAQMTLTADAPGQGAQALPGSSGDVDPQAIVDALFAVSGDHKGARASGAKGVCVKGAFFPPPDAIGLAKALHSI